MKFSSDINHRGILYHSNKNRQTFMGIWDSSSMWINIIVLNWGIIELMRSYNFKTDLNKLCLYFKIFRKLYFVNLYFVDIKTYTNEIIHLININVNMIQIDK